MSTILDFFALRPAFTAWGLRLLWWAFLFETALNITGFGSAVYLNSSPTFSMALLYLPNLLEMIVNAVLVRVLLEVALLVMQRR